MRKITKAALVSGAAAAAIAATVGVAAPAQAHYGAYPHRITTVVTWVGGDSSLAVDYPGEGVVLEMSPSKTATDYWVAATGDRIAPTPSWATPTSSIARCTSTGASRTATAPMPVTALTPTA